jgi:hypothetical protein
MTLCWGSQGKRLTGKLYEPFERADGGRVATPHLLRLYSFRPAPQAESEGPNRTDKAER